MNVTRRIMVGPVPVGGGAPVSVQSMTCTRTGDAEATLAQMQALVAAGCEIVRVSLPTAEEAPAFARLVREAPAPAPGAPRVPVIADIHYDWRLALAAVEAGAAGVRINPGTMAEKHVREIVRAAAEARVPAGGGEAGQPAAAGPSGCEGILYGHALVCLAGLQVLRIRRRGAALHGGHEDRRVPVGDLRGRHARRGALRQRGVEGQDKLLMRPKGLGEADRRPDLGTGKVVEGKLNQNDPMLHSGPASRRRR